MKINFKLVFLCVLLNGVSLVNAQSRGAIYYTLSVAENGLNTSWTERHIVRFANNKSIDLFIPPTQVKESTVQIGENSIAKTVAMGSQSDKISFLLKDFDKKKLTLADNILFKHYLIEDTLANFKWQISNERQKILKYNCTKATTSFRGRVYTAWFTDDVPIQNGPWKFCGLPGLIVKVSDAENKYIFELEGLDLKTAFDDEMINVPIAYANDKAIIHSAFLELYNKKVAQLSAQSRASVNTFSYGSGKATVQSYDSIPPNIEKF